MKHVVIGSGSVIKSWVEVTEKPQSNVKYSQFKEYFSFYCSMALLAVAAVIVAVAMSNPLAVKAFVASMIGGF